MIFIYIFVGLIAILIYFHHNLRWSKILPMNHVIGKERHQVLVVTAHPDDECMFFAPSIIALLGQAKNVYILCLTTGDYYNQGKIREKELNTSCRVLGVDDNCVRIINDSKIQDHPTAVWDEEHVSKVIEQEVQRHNIDLIITFDEHGVSGHVNHKSTYHGVRHLISTAEHKGLIAYKLITTSLFRKYIALLDLPYSYYTSDLLLVSGWIEVGRAQFAMFAHRSQFVWFRILYILFSRYMIFNTLEPIQPRPVAASQLVNDEG